MPTPHHPRHLDLEGAFNMRDLGGVPTSDGYQVQTGKLFRADALHNLTEADLGTLRGYGIASVVDLRTEREIAFMGKAKLVALGARHIHTPLSTDEPILPLGTPLPPNMGDLYAIGATATPHLFVHVVETLASRENTPAVFHCVAGKDRTGMAAALVYSVLGVAREDIVADYVLTDANMDRFLAAEVESSIPLQDDWVEIPAGYDRALATTIRTFLDALDARFGSPVEWLRLNGLPDRAIESLRRTMLA